ncbi:DUF3857 domain-containing protein [Persicobacter sp. CCB-QB2]|uniref:DUF3857 domain-containing protein n=1 Tax=Persicobacter sp. CCB-QB2 TaxID=1561025 RepID=UPI0006A9928E|nr:DUF3857 domain-containing protein [Persicobacter sp. CCB-QB2]
MKRLFLYFNIFCLLFTASPSWAKAPKFGKLSKEEHNLIRVDFEPEADAVELFQNCKVTFGPAVFHKKHFRRKLLTDQVEESGKVEIIFYHHQDMESIHSLNAVVHIPQPDGSYTKIKLSKEQMPTAEISELRSKVSLIFPQLQKGAIIEWEYTLASKRFFFIGPWNYLSRYPILKSTFSFLSPSYLKYQMVMKGDEMTEKYANKNTNTWTLENIKGYDPNARFVDNPFNYANKLSLQLKEYPASGAMGGTEMKSYVHDIQDLANELRKSGNNYRFLRKVTSLAESMPVNVNDYEGIEKAKFILREVQNKYQWNGMYSSSARRTPAQLAKEKKGNSAEINLVLYSILKSYGLDAQLIATSPTQHGFITKVGAFRDQFSTFIVGIPAEHGWHFMDATQPSLPMGYINPDCWNNQALVCESKASWIENLEPKSPSKSLWSLYLNLNEENPHYQVTLSLIGNCIDNIAGGVSEYIARKFHINQEEIADLKVEHQFKQTKITCSLPYQSEAADLLPLIPIKTMDENPFQSDKERNLPLDLNYAYSEQIILNYVLPTDLKAANPPENIRIALPNKAGSLTLLTQINQNSVAISSKYVQQYRFLNANYYPYLRNMAEEVINRQSAYLTIEKNQAN